MPSVGLTVPTVKPVRTTSRWRLPHITDLILT